MVKYKYKMFLTSKLFNKMLNNFKDSLERKRIQLVDSSLRAKQLKKARSMRCKKCKFSKEELQNLVFLLPKIHIVKLHEIKFGIKIGRTTIDRYARKWDLDLPSPYYWTGRKFEGSITSFL